MSYQWILFDLDGTITQSEFGIIESVKYALEKYDIREDSYENLLRFIGPPLYQSFREYYGMSDLEAQTAVAYYREIYEVENYKKSPLYQGIKEVIQTLYDQGKELFVVTAKPVDTALDVMNYHGLTSYFKKIYGPGRDAHKVNKSDFILQLMEDYRIEDKGSLVMIGDRHYDVKGASDLGITGIGALYGYGTREELIENGANYIATCPMDILKIIEEKS